MTPPHRFYKGRALDQELRSLFEEKGKLPDMTHLEHEYHRRTTRILIGLVIFFAIITVVSWLGFFLFGSPRGGSEVTVTFEGPEAVVSGVPQKLTIIYKNDDRTPLAFGSLRIRIPDNLRILQLAPEATSRERYLQWNFGTLPSRQSSKVVLDVIPYGVVDSEVELQAIFSYKPADFNAEFQSVATHTFTIRAPPIGIAFEGPQEVTPGQETKLKIRLRNETDETFNGVRALLVPPSTFVVMPNRPDDATVWDIGTLEPNAQRELDIAGSFLSSAQGKQEVKLQVEITEDGKTTYLLAQGLYPIEVKGGALRIDLLTNGSSEQQWLRPGEPLTITLKLHNTSSEKLTGVRATLQVESSLIDWKVSRVQDGTLEEEKLIFGGKDGVTLAPNGEHEFTATLTLVESPPATSSPVITLRADITYNDTSVSTPPATRVVTSDLALRSEARYHDADGKPVGLGPLPPKVGEATEFAIRLRLKNTFHDLSNIVVTSTLPQPVEWINTVEVQAGKISFNEVTREMRWEVTRMPVTTPEISAQFHIRITPTQEDKGNLVLLLGVTRAEALDTIAQVTFSTDAPSLSSNLEADSFARGKGVVE